MRTSASRVVVYDRYGNPIAVLLEIDPDHVKIEIADNQEAFNRMLKQLGIDRTVLVDTIKGPSQPVV